MEYKRRWQNGTWERFRVTSSLEYFIAKKDKQQKRQSFLIMEKEVKLMNDSSNALAIEFLFKDGKDIFFK